MRYGVVDAAVFTLAQLESKFHELGIDFESEQKELSVSTSRALLAQAVTRFGSLRWCLLILPCLSSVVTPRHGSASA
jgi:hypothetical protein